MAKKTNRKPGANTTMALKKQNSNLNESKLNKVVVILMLLAFIGVPIAGLIIYFI